MTCNHCGTQIPDDSVFCPNCGAAATQANDATYQQPQTQYPQTDYSQPQYNQQPQYNNPAFQQPVTQPGKGFAIAALVLGIVSFFCFPYICGALGIIFGIVAKSKGYRGGMATAGIICGAIGIVLAIVMAVAGLSLSLANM